MRFNNRSDRNLFYCNRFSLKDKNITNLGYQTDNATASTNHELFINESLSVQTKYLYKLARDHCKKKKIATGILLIKKKIATGILLIKKKIATGILLIKKKIATVYY